MADTEFSSFNDRRTSESLGEPAAYQASQGLEEASSEQIFNLTGTAKLSSEHFARLQMDPGTSPSQDQIGAWPPSNSSSSTSVQGKFVPPAGGWVLYDKHKQTRKTGQISSPTKAEHESIRRLNEQRDTIRAQQAQREAARKEAAEQAKAAKAEEEAKQKRAQIEQRRQARAAENAQRREQFSSIDQNYKRYLAGRQQPLFKQLESDFAAKEKEHVREKVEEYNSSLRPPKLKTVRSIIKGEHQPRDKYDPAKPSALPPRGKEGAGTVRARGGRSASADGTRGLSRSQRERVMVDRASSPIVFPVSGDSVDVSGEQPTRTEANSQVLDVTGGVEGQDGGARQVRKSSSSLQALKDRRSSSLRKFHSTASFKGQLGAAPGSRRASQQGSSLDPLGAPAPRLGKLNFSRQPSVDERDDEHALSLTDPLPPEASRDPDVPDTFFVEREDDETQELTPEGGLTASLSNMAAYDPDPPLEFEGAQEVDQEPEQYSADQELGQYSAGEQLDALSEEASPQQDDVLAQDQGEYEEDQLQRDDAAAADEGDPEPLAFGSPQPEQWQQQGDQEVGKQPQEEGAAAASVEDLPQLDTEPEQDAAQGVGSSADGGPAQSGGWTEAEAEAEADAAQSGDADDSAIRTEEANEEGTVVEQAQGEGQLVTDAAPTESLSEVQEEQLVRSASAVVQQEEPVQESGQQELPPTPQPEQADVDPPAQDDKLIGYVFDKAAEDGLAEAGADESGAQPNTESRAEEQEAGRLQAGEPSTGGVGGDPTSTTYLDSMYDESSVLSGGAPDAAAATS